MDQLFTHPDNVDAIKSRLDREARETQPGALLGFMPTFFMPTVEVRPCPYMQRYDPTKPWTFPKERYWEYEESDRDWCEGLGIGHGEMLILKHDPDYWKTRMRMRMSMATPYRPPSAMLTCTS